MKYLLTILLSLFSLMAMATVKDTVATITVRDANHNVVDKQAFVIEHKDTNKIEIPAYIAKQMILDLVSGDSAKAQLAIVYDMYKTMEKKSMLQDSMLKAYQIKNQAFAKQVLLYKEKETQYINYTKDLKKDVKKAKLKNHLATGIGTLVALAGLLFLFVSSGN